MPVALLDVNVLLALAWPTHIHHGAAHAWFTGQRSHGWATCPATQSAFVRLSANPAVVKTTTTAGDALRLLEANAASPEHIFWSQDRALWEILPEIKARLIGHQQAAEALLLDLAIRNHGKLATMDRGAGSLLPPDSEYRSALELVPV